MHPRVKYPWSLLNLLRPSEPSFVFTRCKYFHAIILDYAKFFATILINSGWQKKHFLFINNA